MAEGFVQRRTVFVQEPLSDSKLEEIKREIRAKVERKLEERFIMATVKMFLENEDRWAA